MRRWQVPSASRMESTRPSVSEMARMKDESDGSACEISCSRWAIRGGHQRRRSEMKIRGGDQRWRSGGDQAEIRGRDQTPMHDAGERGLLLEGAIVWLSDVLKWQAGSNQLAIRRHGSSK